MASFYADEDFPFPAVVYLRLLGHDVLTTQEAGKANLRISDEEVLAFAIENDRAILTRNRRHFIRLHYSHPHHTGIVVCSHDQDFERLARRIHSAVSAVVILRGQLIRVVRPS